MTSVVLGLVESPPVEAFARNSLRSLALKVCVHTALTGVTRTVLFSPYSILLGNLCACTVLMRDSCRMFQSVSSVAA